MFSLSTQIDPNFSTVWSVVKSHSLAEMLDISSGVLVNTNSSRLWMERYVVVHENEH